jgi:hypothetical protein
MASALENWGHGPHLYISSNTLIQMGKSQISICANVLINIFKTLFVAGYWWHMSVILATW